VKKNKMQEGSYLLINLVYSDMFKAIFAFPMNSISSFYGRWMFGQIGLRMFFFETELIKLYIIQKIYNKK